MRRTYVVIWSLLLMLFADAGGSVLAAPLPQEDEAIFGLLGTLRPSESTPYDVEFITGGETYPIVGATPTIEQQIQRLSAQEPPRPVKIWGRLVPILGQTDTQQIVAESILPMSQAAPGNTDEEIPISDIPIARVNVQRANVRLSPAPDGELVGQVRRGQEFDLVAQNSTGQWWRICCVNGQYGWIVQQAVTTRGAVETVPTLNPRSRVLLPAIGGASAEDPSYPTTSWRITYYGNLSLQGPPLFMSQADDISFDWGRGSPAPGIVPADQFSARFERTLALEDGFYEFSVQADDGVRVWIDEVLVVNAWHLSTGEVYRFGRRLRGPTPVRIEYFEVGGGASIRFEYETVSDFPDWQATYFDNTTLSGEPDWVRAESPADIALRNHWSLGSPVPGIIPVDNFSARWKGTYAFERGDYLFWARAAGGVRLWINDILVFNAWVPNAGYVEKIFYQVGPGNHEITIEYFAGGGIASIEADWYRLNP